METNWVTTRTKLGSTVHYKENHELSFGKNKTETPNYVFLFRSRENALESYQLLTGNSQQKSQHGILGTGNARPLNITWEWDDCKGSINVISNALRKLKDGLTARMTGATCLFSLCQVSKNGSSLLQGQAGVHLQARCRMAASSTTQYATWPAFPGIPGLPRLVCAACSLAGSSPCPNQRRQADSWRRLPFVPKDSLPWISNLVCAWPG